MSVDVIVLTYGDFQYLRNTLDSVFAQEYPIDRVVVSDDGSGKMFPDIFQMMFPKAEFRQNASNLGTVMHMNLLATMCSSTYLKFLAAGDAFSDAGALGALVAHAKKTHAMVATSNALITSQDLSHVYYEFPGVLRAKALQNRGPELFRALARANIVSAAGTLLHRDFFDVLGGFDPRYRFLEDWPAWLRLAREGYPISYLDRVTCKYSVGGVSSKDGNAFYSQRLRQDMLRCYEQEILPELSAFSEKDVRYIRYHYELLYSDNSKILWTSYPDLHVRNLLKRGIKWIILKYKWDIKDRR